MQSDIERKEWLDSLEWLMADSDSQSVDGTLKAVFSQYRQFGGQQYFSSSAYTNSILHPELNCPDSSRRANELIRWNAMAMVVQGTKVGSEIGGHIASYASSAMIYDVAFEHFFQGGVGEEQDCIYFQGHCAPGMYARAYLEGRLTDTDLLHFRQEASQPGLSSYPHPRLMPDFWSFPTVSMGLGPLMAIYQARFDRYLIARGLMKNTARTVYAFCGDGEMDEPESLGALGVASREKLDNLVFVVNCNLQRLDGPVRGNGKIIQELESIFAGFGWRVIKLVWNQAWLDVIANDPTGQLIQVLGETVDGEFQAISGNRELMRERIFSQSSKLLQYFDSLSEEAVNRLEAGGHDYGLIHSAFSQAKTRNGQPTVMLVQTVKGYGLGAGVRAANSTHNQKKMNEDQLLALAKQWNIPMSEDDVRAAKFYHPGHEDQAIQYLHAARQKLGGYLPQRSYQGQALEPVDLKSFQALLDGSERPMSTTMAFVRILGSLLRDKGIKRHVVPIVPDESRTFGMEGLFRQVGIYAPHGQKYTPIDKEQMMFYKESQDGQLLQEGINEAGAMSSWIAAACAYANCSVPMVPFYIYYSMFGFQRVGDLAWAAADARARGFLIGATAGRTTLAGEGLQHNDGHSHVFSGVIPSCVSYDPAFAYELAVIVTEGIRRMMVEQEDVFYYITVMNENAVQPPMPEGVEEGIISGMYLYQSQPGDNRVNLLGSGMIMQEVIAAGQWLHEQGIGSNIFSVTSYTELARKAQYERRAARMKGEHFSGGYVASLLEDRITVSASDYVKTIGEQIRESVPGRYYTLGTDGYGRSDTRARLRDFHEVSWRYIAFTALYGLLEEGKISKDQLLAYREQLAIPVNKECPVSEGVCI